MSLETLRERKRDLEQIKEYQCGDHPTRILYVNNLNLKDYQALKTLLEAQPQTIKAIFIDELHRYNFVLISFYDLREAIIIHRLLHKTQKYSVHYALAKDVLDDKEQNQGTIVVFNVEYSVTNDELKEFFSQCGDIKEIRETPLKKHHRFVEFFDLRDAQRAINELNQCELKGRKLKIEPSRPYGIRQRVLHSCVNALGMNESIFGLPPPQEMMKLVNRRMKEIEYPHHSKYTFTHTVNHSVQSRNETERFDRQRQQRSSSTIIESPQRHQPIDMNITVNSPIRSSTNPINKSPLMISTSSSTSLDCLSSLPSVSSQPIDTVNTLPTINTITSLSTINEMNTTNTINQNDQINQINQTEYEMKSIKPIEFATSSTSLFCSLSSNAISSTPSSSSSQSSPSPLLPSHKDDNLIINVPRPTTIGQELSKQYCKDVIGTPHLQEKKYNYFTQLEAKGLGFDEKEDVDEMKRVLVIENIPITYTYHELLTRIEKCISCFYDQFLILNSSDNETYRCIIRVTNQMVVENFMLAFDKIFLEDDQDVLCRVREIHCQGNYFSKQLKTLLV